MQAEQAVASRTDSRVATQAEPNVVAVLPPLPLLHLSTSRCRPRQTRVRTTCVHLDQPVPQRGHPDCQSGTSSTCTRPPIPAIPQLLPALKRKHTHTNTRSREKKQQQQRTHPEEEHTERRKRGPEAKASLVPAKAKILQSRQTNAPSRAPSARTRSVSSPRLMATSVDHHLTVRPTLSAAAGY